MMKKHLIYFFFFTMLFSSCKKENTDPVIGNVDERLSDTLAFYQSQLTNAEFGWKGYLLTDNETPATFLFNFNDKNRTIMSADYKTTPAESSYRLKALQRPTLMFDSYSTLHLIADPTSSVFNGTTANGYFSDFEFAFLSANADTIKLEGTFNKSKLILIKSKSAEESSTLFSSLQEIIESLSKLKTYFKRTSIGGVDCEIKLDGTAQVLEFSYLTDGVTAVTLSSSFYVSGKDIVLYEPLIIGTTTVSELTGVNYDANNSVIKANIGDLQIQIKEAIEPMSYDKTATERFYNMPPNGNYWMASRGFTVDGKVDAYGVRDIPFFNYIIFWPKYNPGYSRFGYIVNDDWANYGPAPIASFPEDGTIKFTNAGSFGTPPPAILPIITNTSNNLFLPKGFYVIKTADKVYDLVSVSDARSWITIGN
ncbi:DUF4302 domain-containing protein [Sphingobacterium sp. SG20118]|uniref:DUF4302 domain-containing protein n=1 Tax=Sphingobacterium sp. SG20118 TaxID=3367156 RepID=UPI0037DFC87C